MGSDSKNNSMLKRFWKKDTLEVGCDEAGRGCLAGPVVAAAAVVPKTFKHKLLNDSKKLTEKQRNELRKIIEIEFEYWAVGIVSEKEIDEINILNASFLAMHRAIDKLKIVPELILVDGNRFNPYKNIPHQTIVKGDAKIMSIAAASILAKTHRDEIMEKFHQEYPVYDWQKNKGYPTVKHRAAIQQFGDTKYHRKSFKLLPSQLELDF